MQALGMNMGTEVSDQMLLSQIRAGDMDAFRHLVHRYEGTIANTVIGMVGPCVEADDIGQEVFVRFFKAVHKFREEASVKTYLTRIAINLSLNEIKARKRRQIFGFLHHQNDQTLAFPDYSWSPEQGEKAAWVQQAIQLLPPNARAVIVLRMIEGYSTKETAELLNLPVGTILSRLARAQDKLKKILIQLDKSNET